MKQLVEFPLEGGGSIVVEVEGAAGGPGVVRGGRPGEIIDQAKQSFETALEKLKPAAAAIIAKLRDLSEPPDEIEVEFGIKLNADVGVILASAGAEANYTVTLTWRHKA
ncbi:MAG: CU044_2847 family protein [Candidatus Binatia bacterium]